MKLKHFISITIVAGSTLLLGSCAVSNQPISFDQVKLSDSIGFATDIKITYSHDNVLLQTNNTRTAKKAERKGLKFYPICINNSGVDTFYIEKSRAEAFVDFETAPILEKSTYFKMVKQKPAYHLIGIGIALIYYFPLTSHGFQFLPENPTGVYIPWAIYSTIKARKANKLLYNDFDKLDIMGKKVAPGQSIFGIICVKSKSNGCLLLRFR
jgi:hypothetical protein